MISQKAKSLAVQLIKEGEGYYEKVYMDTTGHWTIGFGHKLLKHEIGKLNVITKAKAEEMLLEELEDAVSEAKNYWEEHLNSMNAERTAVVLDMTYNLGSIKWPKLTQAIHACNWKKAGDEIMDSLYAKQVKNRARRNAAIMRDGKMHSKSEWE